MAEVDPERLLLIVTGIQINAELGDRPLAYRVEEEARRILKADAGTNGAGAAAAADANEAAAASPLVPVVVSDVLYLNTETLQSRPVISIGGPGMNALSAMLVNDLPTALAIENVLVIQMDLDLKDRRCAVWGMNHLDTVRAVETFVAKGYLETFVKGVAVGT